MKEEEDLRHVLLKSDMDSPGTKIHNNLLSEWGDASS